MLRIELTRAVTRALPALLPDARDLLLAFSFVAIDDDIVEGAMSEPERGLRSLDAIHLATARVLGEDLDAIVSYDDRLLRAATELPLLIAPVELQHILRDPMIANLVIFDHPYNAEIG